MAFVDFAFCGLLTLPLSGTEQRLIYGRHGISRDTLALKSREELYRLRDIAYTLRF
jgi:hypothetical protein